MSTLEDRRQEVREDKEAEYARQQYLQSVNVAVDHVRWRLENSFKRMTREQVWRYIERYGDGI